jgi:hypothetical protein
MNDSQGVVLQTEGQRREREESTGQEQQGAQESTGRRQEGQGRDNNRNSESRELQQHGRYEHSTHHSREQGHTGGKGRAGHRVEEDEGQEHRTREGRGGQDLSSINSEAYGHDRFLNRELVKDLVVVIHSDLS